MGLMADEIQLNQRTSELKDRLKGKTDRKNPIYIKQSKMYRG